MSMRPIVLHIRTDLQGAAKDIDRSHRALLWAMEALQQINELWLRDSPATPGIYQAGVFWKPETARLIFAPSVGDSLPCEEWMDIPTILSQEPDHNGRRFADCEDLAVWRAAELRVREGVDAHPFLRWRRTANGMGYHALTRRADGRIEDPSLALGMHGGMVTGEPVFVGRVRPGELL